LIFVFDAVDFAAGLRFLFFSFFFGQVYFVLGCVFLFFALRLFATAAATEKESRMFAGYTTQPVYVQSMGGFHLDRQSVGWQARSQT